MNINVLQVIPNLGYGGAETGCYDLAHYLSEKGCKSYIVTGGGALIKFVRKDKVKIIKLPVASKNPLLILFNTLALSLIILFLNINIVHARSRAPAWSCILSCFLTRRKFVTTFHGTYNFSNKLKKFYNSVMVKSNLVIAGSNFIFNHINENYFKYQNPKNKLMVIFRGINLDFFSKKNVSEKKKNELINNWKIDTDQFIILLPGRLTKWKGQEMFIEAINLVNKEIDPETFNVIILGSDQGRKIYKQKLLRLVEQHRLANQVKFIDNCKNMPVAYKISDLIVSSSIEPEAFGRVVVEAQSMEKPIIASNIGGSKETIINDKTGFLFEAGKPASLSKKIIEVMQLDETTLKSLGNEGRKNVIKKFNIEKMCFSTYLEYKKLIN